MEKVRTQQIAHRDGSQYRFIAEPELGRFVRVLLEIVDPKNNGPDTREPLWRKASESMSVPLAEIYRLVSGIEDPEPKQVLLLAKALKLEQTQIDSLMRSVGYKRLE